MTNRDSTTTKISFILNEPNMKLLDQLVIECGFSDRKELMNNAITLMGWAVKQIKDGRSVAGVSEADKLYRELDMPWMKCVVKEHTS